MTEDQYRIESDTIGPVKIPKDALWGPQTERSRHNFPSGELMPLTIIGALNWGLIGIFGFDIVAFIFGPATIASSIVYSIIGIAALVWLIWMIIYRPVRNER